ncbi:MAG: GNAT family protein [Rhodobacteraceae bacterium]|nr:GNAT family protein [Paracoccaceae bacterium]
MSKSPILTTAEITLRPPRADDVHARMSLGRDPDIVRMFGLVLDGPGTVTEEEAADWLDHLRLQEHGWVIEHQGRLIGSAFLHSVDHTDRHAKLALGILDPECLGRGLGRRIVPLVLTHAFGPVGLHRVELRVLAYNERAIRCYRACGFAEEGRLRESALVGGVWHDDVIMAILAPAFFARLATPDRASG